MKRILTFGAALLLFPAVFVAGIMFADYGVSDFDATLTPPTVLFDEAPPATIEQPANLLALMDAKSAGAAPASWPELCTINHSPTNRNRIQVFCAPGVLTVPSVTPTGIVTLIPTNTPRATATKTPTKTATAEIEPSPTPWDDTGSPTPIGDDIDAKNCDVKTNQSGIALRLGHSTTAQLIDRLTLGQSLKVFEFWPNGNDAWAKIYDPIHTEAWFMIRSAGVWWIDVVGDADWCGTVPGWNDAWTPPTIYNPAGLHVLGGFASVYAILAEIDGFGVLKVTDDARFLFDEARKLNPRLITVHRNIHVLDHGLKNCPDGYGVGGAVEARALARSWFDVQWRTLLARNLAGVATYQEQQNECGYPGAVYENAYWLEMIRLAKEKGICLAIYSDSFGTPEIAQFIARKPVFDAILKTPCAPGRYHVISLHTYGRIDSGMWIFGRWLLFRAALGSTYNNLTFIFTEMGVTSASGNNDGRGSADCGTAAKETAELTAEFRKHREVIGYNLYSFGAGTEWLDLTPCLGQIASALQ